MLNEELKLKIAAIVESHGCILYDITTPRENDHQILRITITKEGGVGFEECEAISEVISPLLDVADPFKGDYFLEVSSPGIERTLKTLAHFQGAVGELVKVKLKDKKEIRGELIAVELQEDSIADSKEQYSLKIKTEKGLLEILKIDLIQKAVTYFKF